MAMLDPNAMDALCDRLLSRLLPALQPLVEEAASKAALLAVKSFNTEPQFLWVLRLKYCRFVMICHFFCVDLSIHFKGD